MRISDWSSDVCSSDLQRPERLQQPANRYSELERQRILSVLNSEEYGHLPPSQIVPRLADRGEYLASESTMYRLLRSVGQLAPRGRPRAPSPQSKPRDNPAGTSGKSDAWGKGVSVSGRTGVGVRIKKKK